MNNKEDSCWHYASNLPGKTGSSVGPTITANNKKKKKSKQVQAPLFSIVYKQAVFTDYLDWLQMNGLKPKIK